MNEAQNKQFLYCNTEGYDIRDKKDVVENLFKETWTVAEHGRPTKEHLPCLDQILKNMLKISKGSNKEKAKIKELKDYIYFARTAGTAFRSPQAMEDMIQKQHGVTTYAAARSVRGGRRKRRRRTRRRRKRTKKRRRKRNLKKRTRRRRKRRRRRK